MTYGDIVRQMDNYELSKIIMICIAEYSKGLSDIGSGIRYSKHFGQYFKDVADEIYNTLSEEYNNEHN